MVSHVSALPLYPFDLRSCLMRQSAIASLLSLALILSLLPLVASAASEQPSVTTPPQPKSALFIGNSFTYYNNSLHMHVLNITKNASRKQERTNQEDTFYTKAMTISGGYLKDHALGAKGMIQDFTDGKKPGPWDVVVVQGYSRGPLTQETAPSFRSNGRKIDSWIRDAGSQTVLFMTWAYQGRPEMTAPLVKAYTDLGNELGALVAPVGLAFENARIANPAMNLYAPDKKHPSLLGTYLAANVFFATLFGESPVGSSYTAGLSDKQAAFAQSVAWHTVQQYFGDKPDA